MYNTNKPVTCEQCGEALRLSSIKALEPELSTCGNNDIDVYQLEIAFLYSCDPCGRVYAVYDKWKWELDHKISKPAVGEVTTDTSKLRLIHPSEDKPKKTPKLPEGAVLQKGHLTLYLGGKNDNFTINEEIEQDENIKRIPTKPAKHKVDDNSKKTTRKKINKE